MNNKRGFTLVELIVVITMLALMSTFLLVLLNVSTQLNKARDAQRREDLQQIRNALDVYYNDNNCYPPQAGFSGKGLPFGSEWASGTNVYMQKVPQDPDYSSTGWSYIYQTDSSSCPQWAVIYAHLVSSNISATQSCQTFQACGYLQTKYNYCLMSGNLNCSYIRTNPLPIPTVILPTATPTPTGVVPTPTPSYYYCAYDPTTKSYTCSSVSSSQQNMVCSPPAGSGTNTCYSSPWNCVGGACCNNNCP